MLVAINLIISIFVAVAHGKDLGQMGMAQQLTLHEQKLWLRYLQIPESHKPRSLITNPNFFITPSGGENPWNEWAASVQKLENPSTAGEDFLCSFPARKRLIEKILKKNYPLKKCPDVDRWVQAFGGQKIWIIYAGAYRNNPASLFGHTFLRFDQQSEKDPSVSLRSQSVGFLAMTSPEDGPTMTVAKGLLGLYQGAFSIQPYYMQTALYNNAEARSLWEFELDLTEEEKQWAVLYMWELGQRGSMVYRFFDENCSYHLLGFLEALRSGTALTQDSGFFVLPLETIRLLDKKGMIKKQKPIYQASIRTRLKARLKQMTHFQKALYRKARSRLETVKNLDDIQILDALIDYQTFHNYKKKTKLTLQEQEIFEATFSQRARLGNPSEGIILTPSLESPLLSHRPSWWQAGISDDDISLKGLMGAHDLISSQEGLEDSSTMEYGGLQVNWSHAENQFQRIQILIARARTLNSWSLEEPQFSWTLDGAWQEFRYRDRWVRGVNSGAGGGFSWSDWNRQWTVAVMGEARIMPGGEWDAAQVGLGPWALLRFENSRFVFAYESRHLRFGSRYFDQNDVQLLPKFIGHKDLRWILQWRQMGFKKESEKSLQLSLRYYF